jgi:hypothetical protein
MPVIVPVFPSTPLYKERVRLEGRDYIFRFDWNDREQRYYMHIFDQDEVPLLLGVKVIANWGMLTRHHFNPALPPGELIPMDLEQGGEPPTFDDFGTRVRLFYYASDEDLSEFAT